MNRLVLITITCLTVLPQTLFAESCRSAAAVISKDYPTANFETCNVTSESQFELTLVPEDEPINPSPWFGFSVTHLKAKDPQPITVNLIYSVAPHRYIPKYSYDKQNWRVIPDSQVNLINENNISITIPQGESPVTYVSAQAILDEESNNQWLTEMDTKYPSTERRTIGYSIAKRPIEALLVNENADRVVLLLSRQHPPEISGAMAFRFFSETLLSLKNLSAGKPQSPETAFFREHMLLMIPHLNPDGVEAGYWRHNLGSKDLNRDWFSGSQPEVASVLRFIEGLEQSGKQIVLNLDFHSTRRDVMYVQMEDDDTNPADFAVSWFNLAEALGLEKLPEFAPRPLTEQGTSKGYFFKTYGIPSITYEVGDETDVSNIKNTASKFAQALALLYGEIVAGRQKTPSHTCDTLSCFMVQGNSASLIMLSEEDLIDSGIAAEIANQQLKFQQDAWQNGWPAGQNYLDLEAAYVANIGWDASNVHIGRSRQDLHGVARRMLARQLTLKHIDHVLSVRKVLLNQSERYADTVIPAYTHGVPSQPTTYGHFLLAFEAAFGRDTERLMEAYIRMNQSQLGVAAGSGSGFDLDRDRMAQLLGFDKAIENTFDANFLSTADYKLELGSVVAQSVATITKYNENLHAQQRNPHPWISLNAERTSGSSIMPQKRNPRDIDKVRRMAGKVLAGVSELTLLNHNVDTGMHDYRDLNPLVELLENAESLLLAFKKLILHVNIDRQLALDEINKGYSTSTEIADVLYRETDASFRQAHLVAKTLTDLVRDRGQPLVALTDEDIRKTFADTVGVPLPIQISRIKEGIDPEGFIALRNVPGGPSKRDVLTSAKERTKNLHEDLIWLQSERESLSEREYWLNRYISELASSPADARP